MPTTLTRMTPKISTLLLTSLFLLPVQASFATSSVESRLPQAAEAEEKFFQLLNHQPQERDAALRDLMLAYVLDPGDARTNLLIGLNHLWLAAEGDFNDPRVLEHVYLAEAFLERAQELNPDDARIPSWLLPARMARANFERDFAAVREAKKQLIEAYESDPNFHAFVVGTQSFADDRDSESFAFGLEAMRSATGCAGSDDPTCDNHPRWPHNAEAFLVLAADFEAKAGQAEEAQALLRQVQSIDSYSNWPYRDAVDERLRDLSQRVELYGNDDPDDDPPSLFTADNRMTCQACHRTK